MARTRDQKNSETASPKAPKPPPQAKCGAKARPKKSTESEKKEKKSTESETEKKEKTLKMDPNNVYSRVYRAAKRAGKSKEEAGLVWKVCVWELGFGSHWQARECANAAVAALPKS